MASQINLTPIQFQKLLGKCSGKRIAIDTETTGLFWWKDKLITVGFFCPDADVSGSIDIRENWSEQPQKEIQDIVKSTLAPGTIVIMHNAKFDLHFLNVNPNETGWKIIDTTVLIHLIDSRYHKSMATAEKILLDTNSKRQEIEKAPARKKVWDWPADIRQNYCLNDCRVTYQFAEVLFPFVKQQELDKLFVKEMKYLSVIYETEHNGILIDPEFIEAAGVFLEERQKELESKLYDACGKTFNWRSNQQLSQAIYEDMGIPKPINPFLSADGLDHTKFVDRGMYNKTCTSAFLLMEKAHHPLGELISAIRESAKLQKVLQQWTELADENSVIHTNFNLTGTRTGRLSSSKPNMQNVPSDIRSRFTSGVYSGGNIRTEQYNLRNAFIARSNQIFLSIDYRQMEMRMFGILSGDTLLIGALKSGVDIHNWIANQVWGDCGEEQNAIHRDWSKAITFGLVYGMTTGGLQFKLEMTRAQAQKVSDEYWNRFPRIKPWMTEVINECRHNGYVKYWSGRKWHEEEEMMFYKSANALIQGGCADLLSVAVIRVHKWLQEIGWGKIVNLVHDEIIVEIPETELNIAAIELSEIMQVEDLFNMPFLTSCKKGCSYGSLEKFVPVKEQI